MADYDRRSNSPVNNQDTPMKQEDELSKGGRSERSRSRSLSRSPKREDSRRSRSPSPPRRSSSRRRSPDRRSRRRSRSRSKSRDRRRSVSPRRRSRSPRRQRSSKVEDDKEFHGTRDEPEVSNILGVFGLSLRTREVDLEDVFREYGSLEKVTIVYDHRSNRSRGFGFVYFKEQTEAAHARDALNGTDIDDRKIRVDYSVTHRPHTPTPGEYMGERRSFDRDRDRRPFRNDRNDRNDRRRRSRSRSRDKRRRYYRSRSRSRSWSR